VKVRKKSVVWKNISPVFRYAVRMIMMAVNRKPQKSERTDEMDLLCPK